MKHMRQSGEHTAETTSVDNSRSAFPLWASLIACWSSTELITLSVALAPTRNESDCLDASAPLMLICPPCRKKEKMGTGRPSASMRHGRGSGKVHPSDAR